MLATMSKHQTDMKFKLALLLATSLVASQAIAAEWMFVGGNSKLQTFLDVQSIRRNGSKVKVWVKWIDSDPVVAKGVYPERKYQSSKTLEIYDCSDRSTTTIQQILYAEPDGGDVVKSNSISEKSAQFEEVIPESIGEAILLAVCKRTNLKK